MFRPLVALAAVSLLCSGCGSHAQSPLKVVRAWSAALNADENERAADLFARDARVVQGDLITRLHTHAEAVAFNASLPCSGRIIDLQKRGDEVEATFVLGNRRSSRCDGTGERAAAIFRIRKGKIVLWHQIGAAAPDLGSGA